MESDEGFYLCLDGCLNGHRRNQSDGEASLAGRAPCVTGTWVLDTLLAMGPRSH